MMDRLLILGTGGNCIDILDAVLEINRVSGSEIYSFAGFLDDNPESWGEKIFGFPVLGPLEKAAQFEGYFIINGIGSPANFWRKKEIIGKTNCPIDRYATIIHPTASVSRFSRIGRGVAVLQNVTIASGAEVGSHVIVLPGSVISHDAHVGDYCCIAAGVCLSGNVVVEENCYLGSNCVIRNNIRIGKGSLVGMGSVVVDHVSENSVVIGNPSRFFRKVH
jgi:sugar O-acyltransferase (sialic acid O-acetyltransferase NeuD family)